MKRPALPSSLPLARSPLPWPRRRFLQAGGTAMALLGSGLLAACGGDDGPAPAAPGAGPGKPGGGLGAVPPPAPPATGYTVQGRQILFNGNPYVAQGVCYSPLPIGANFGWPPIGDFFTPFWHAIWERDLPRMKAIGINAIRLYSTTPWADPINPSSAANSHIAFLDACQAHGISVWAAYPIDSGAYGNNTPGYKDILNQGVAAIATEMANHPAVVGFIIGNELNSAATRSDPNWWAWLDGLAATAKTNAPNKLTMMALVDDSMITVQAAHTYGNGAPHFDVFGINSYRGTETSGFDVLFSSYASADSRPLLITEWGCPASGRDASGKIIELPNRAQAQANYLRSHWLDISNNLSTCSGGYIFEWQDEWWKNGDPVVHDPAVPTGANPAFPGGWDDEEWFGLHAVALNNRPASEPNYNNGQNPDLLTSRAAVDTLKALWGA